MATRSCVISIGAAIGVGSVPWNTSNAKRSRVPWLPAVNVPFLNADGTVSRVWYLFLQHIAETRLGGINGATVPQVATTVTQTQSAVVATQTTVTETIAYARSIDSAATALKSVAINNALTGASTVPDPGTPPKGTYAP